jgi:hypothetical protein
LSREASVGFSHVREENRWVGLIAFCKKEARVDVKRYGSRMCLGSWAAAIFIKGKYTGKRRTLWFRVRRFITIREM